MLNVKQIQKKLNIDEITAKVFKKRGIDTEEKIDKFINSSLENLHDPALIPGMDDVVKKIKEHIPNNHITVYGDFDVDGTTSSVIMYTAIKKYCKSANVDILPGNRYRDGYGLSYESIDMMAENGTDLIITTDNGISCKDEIDYANLCGMEVVVIDHHESEDPPDCPFVDLKANQGDYPFRDLCAGGMAWKVGQYLLQDEFVDVIDLVAIATVADVVPLIGENRIIAKEGIINMRIGQCNNGIKALMRLFNIEEERLISSDIGYSIGPAMNAAGRLESPEPVVELLLSDNMEQLYSLAYELYNTNENRKDRTRELLKTLRKQVDDKVNVIVEKAEILRGLVGLVAGEIKRAFKKPVIVVDSASNKGSARSIKPFHMYDNLKICCEEGLLAKAGGHEMAAGMTVTEDKFDKFKARINELAEGVEYIHEGFDIEVDLSELTKEVVLNLRLLEPCGEQNPTPMFKATNLKAESIDLTRTGEHVRFMVDDIEAIAFKMADKLELLVEGRVDIIFQPAINYWNGSETLQLIVRDIQKAKNIG